MSQLTDAKGHVLSCSDKVRDEEGFTWWVLCLLYTSPSPRDVEESRMPSSA